jgi:hypothetical protein
MLRCPGCRTRRATFASMLLHIRATGHDLCNCGGFHFKHRPGSSCCERNPWAALCQAKRAGAPLNEQLDIAADLAVDLPGKPMKEWT